MAITLRRGAVSTAAVGTLLSVFLVGCQDPPKREWEPTPLPVQAEAQGWERQPHAGGQPGFTQPGTGIDPSEIHPSGDQIRQTAHEFPAPVDTGRNRIMRPIEGEPPSPVIPTSFSPDGLDGVPGLPESSFSMTDAPMPKTPDVAQTFGSGPVPVEPMPPEPPMPESPAPYTSSNYQQPEDVQFHSTCPSGNCSPGNCSTGSCPTSRAEVPPPPPYSVTPPTPPMPESFQNSPLKLPSTTP